jgi:hypothetical protein
MSRRDDENFSSYSVTSDDGDDDDVCAVVLVASFRRHCSLRIATRYLIGLSLYGSSLTPSFNAKSASIRAASGLRGSVDPLCIANQR